MVAVALPQGVRVVGVQGCGTVLRVVARVFPQGRLEVAYGGVGGLGRGSGPPGAGEEDTAEGVLQAGTPPVAGGRAGEGAFGEFLGGVEFGGGVGLPRVRDEQAHQRAEDHRVLRAELGGGVGELPGRDDGFAERGEVPDPGVPLDQRHDQPGGQLGGHLGVRRQDGEALTAGGDRLVEQGEVEGVPVPVGQDLREPGESAGPVGGGVGRLQGTSGGGFGAVEAAAPVHLAVGEQQVGEGTEDPAVVGVRSAGRGQPGDGGEGLREDRRVAVLAILVHRGGGVRRHRLRARTVAAEALGHQPQGESPVGGVAAQLVAVLVVAAEVGGVLGGLRAVQRRVRLDGPVQGLRVAAAGEALGEHPGAAAPQGVVDEVVVGVAAHAAHEVQGLVEQGDVLAFLGGGLEQDTQRVRGLAQPCAARRVQGGERGTGQGGGVPGEGGVAQPCGSVGEEPGEVAGADGRGVRCGGLVSGAGVADRGFLVGGVGVPGEALFREVGEEIVDGPVGRGVRGRAAERAGGADQGGVQAAGAQPVGGGGGAGAGRESGGEAAGGARGGGVDLGRRVDEGAQGRGNGHPLGAVQDRGGEEGGREFRRVLAAAGRRLHRRRGQGGQRARVGGRRGRQVPAVA
ncbi:hypothetical protein SGLAM104S_02402 [Streptomyces glaucescens]